MWFGAKSVVDVIIASHNDSSDYPYPFSNYRNFCNLIHLNRKNRIRSSSFKSPLDDVLAMCPPSLPFYKFFFLLKYLHCPCSWSLMNGSENSKFLWRISTVILLVWQCNAKHVKDERERERLRRRWTEHGGWQGWRTTTGTCIGLETAINGCHLTSNRGQISNPVQSLNP